MKARMKLSVAFILVFLIVAMMGFPSPTSGGSLFRPESDDLLDERNLNEDDEDDEMESVQKRFIPRNWKTCFDHPCSNEGNMCCNTNAGIFTCVNGLCKLTHPDRG